MEPAGDFTQKLTQEQYDTRRTGSNVSSLSPLDAADLICILHPCTLAAIAVVARTASRSPQHVLQPGREYAYQDELSQVYADEQETFVLSDDEAMHPSALALRFSSQVIHPGLQFLFGRNAGTCDFVLDTDSNRRVSNVHFRIFINVHGVCMLQDMSTNGTVVDGIYLQGKGATAPQTRMLSSNSEIQILSPRPEEILKFIVRIPSRSNSEDEYATKFHAYMRRVAEAESLAHQMDQGNRALRNFARTDFVAKKANTRSTANVLSVRSEFGMHWNGSPDYNVVGSLGRGAFAKVFQLATKADGVFYAAKELEKRRFMKNGILDRKLDNEMQIMKDLVHDNIVKFVDYHDHAQHLYIIMEFVPCGNLQELITREGALPEQTSRIMASQIFSALNYLHTKLITHRDIKPDNILLADTDPDDFHVKLTDFGLSKVVADNATFLKTFCGTLLYCAPEVFPQYDNVNPAVPGARKRTRGGGAHQKFHSYSQSVDVWSFGAVLWFALCAQTPWAGIMDANGQAMFDRIMQTPLIFGALQNAGVSQLAMQLLASMLNTNPAARPTPLACLQHGWFNGMQLSILLEQDVYNEGLGAISEEEDEAPHDVHHELSQLRIHESRVHGHEMPAIDPFQLDITGLRGSKRFKVNQRDDFSSDVDHDRSDTRAGMSRGQPQQRPLFGEIAASGLARLPPDSQMLDAFDQSDQSEIQVESDTSEGQRQDALHDGQPRPDSFTLGRQKNITSLSGAESLVRELHMDSPQSHSSPRFASHSPPSNSYGPRTPRTPEPQQSSSVSHGRVSQDTPTKPSEATPKPVFVRRIDPLPLVPEQYYDANDPSTHTLEYASRMAGHDFTLQPVVAAASFLALQRASGLAAPAPLDRSDGTTTMAQHSAVAAASFHAMKRASELAAADYPLTTQHGPEGQGGGGNDGRSQRRSDAVLAHATLDPDTAHGAIAQDPSRDCHLSSAVQLSQPLGKQAMAMSRHAEAPNNAGPYYGRLVTTKDSFADIVIEMRARLTSFGREGSNCTYMYDNNTIPRYALYLMFDAPGIVQAQNKGEDWANFPRLSCVVTTDAKTGILVNGTKLPGRSTVRDEITYGRLAKGDVITVVSGKPGKNGERGSGLSFVVESLECGEGKEGRSETEEFKVLTQAKPAGRS